MIPYELTHNQSSTTQIIEGVTLTKDFILRIEFLPCTYVLSAPVIAQLKVNYGFEGNKTFDVEITITNVKPIINETAVDQVFTVLNPNLYYNVQYFFRDIYSRPLTINVQLQNGSALPYWIQWNATSQLFTIQAGDLQLTYVTVIATTPESISKNQTFKVEIMNNPPLVGAGFTPITKYENISFSITLN